MWASSPLRPLPRGHVRRMRGPGARSHKEMLSHAHTVCVCVLSGGTLKVHTHLKLEVGITIIVVCCQVEVWPELYPL